MSEMAKKARGDMRAKIRRLTTVDPHQKVDASDWTPPEPLKAGQKIYDKAKEKSATTKIYKHGGRIQGDRGPRRKDRAPRGGYSSGGTVDRAAAMCAGGDSGIVKARRSGGEVRSGNYTGGTRPTGGRIARAAGGRSSNPNYDRTRSLIGGNNPKYNKEAVDKEIRKDKRIGGKEANSIHRLLSGRSSEKEMRRQVMDEGSYQEGDDKLKRGGRTKRAEGGRTKSKKGTTINIHVGQQQPAAPPMPPQAVVRPPMPPPPMPPPGGMPPMGGAPPMGGPPGGPGGPPMLPPSMAGGPPPGRKRGGMVHMRGGAGGGLGRLEKTKIQARENRSHG